LNNIELQKKVRSAMYTLIKEKGVASPAEVLISVGVLSKEDYENWRFGRVDYLERVCKVNLGKLATISREIRAYAKKANLKASWTDYRQWGVKKKHGHKPQKPRLRFSKSGDEQIERFYATHYVNVFAVKQAKEQQKIAEISENCD
jgi:hypothetical protein